MLQCKRDKIARVLPCLLTDALGTKKNNPATCRRLTSFLEFYIMTRQYMPDRPSLNYSLRPRRHNITLITKTSEFNHRDFIIRNIYKAIY